MTVVVSRLLPRSWFTLQWRGPGADLASADRSDESTHSEQRSRDSPSSISLLLSAWAHSLHQCPPEQVSHGLSTLRCPRCVRKWQSHPAPESQVQNQTCFPKSTRLCVSPRSSRACSKEYSPREQRRDTWRDRTRCSQGSGNSCTFLNITVSMRPALLALTCAAFYPRPRLRNRCVTGFCATALVPQAQLRMLQLTLMGGPASPAMANFPSMPTSRAGSRRP